MMLKRKTAGTHNKPPMPTGEEVVVSVNLTSTEWEILSRMVKTGLFGFSVSNAIGRIVDFYIMTHADENLHDVGVPVHRMIWDKVEPTPAKKKKAGG